MARLDEKHEKLILNFLKSKIRTDLDSIGSTDLYTALGGQKTFGKTYQSWHASIKGSRISGAFPGFSCQQRYGWILDDGFEKDRIARISKSACNKTVVKQEARRRVVSSLDEMEAFADEQVAKAAAPQLPPAQEITPPTVALAKAPTYPLEIQNLIEKETAGFSIRVTELCAGFMQGMVDAMNDHAKNIRMLVSASDHMNG